MTILVDSVQKFKVRFATDDVPPEFLESEKKAVEEFLLVCKVNKKKFFCRLSWHLESGEREGTAQMFLVSYLGE